MEGLEVGEEEGLPDDDMEPRGDVEGDTLCVREEELLELLLEEGDDEGEELEREDGDVEWV